VRGLRLPNAEERLLSVFEGILVSEDFVVIIVKYSERMRSKSNGGCGSRVPNMLGS
jgi:hypothetical protein